MIPEHKYEIVLINGQRLYVPDFEHVRTKWGNAIAVELDDGTPYFINEEEIHVILEKEEK